MSAVPIRTLLVLVPILAVLLAVPALVGVYVYRDAGRREMNAVLWTLIAIIAPALIGFIIYLLVRGGHPDLECPRCGSPVTEQYVVCPQCGAKLRPACPVCSSPVEPDWKVCPRCAAPLDGPQVHTAPPLRRQDKTLNRILAAVILVPVLLIALAVASFYTPGVSIGPTSMEALTFNEYDEAQPSETVRNAVHRWLDSVGGRQDRAYALRYELPGEYDYENRHYFLVYIPTADGRHTNFGSNSGLFGSSLLLDLWGTGENSYLFCFETRAEKPPRLDITLDGKHIRCDVREVNYNPTTFPIYPNYAQTNPDEVLFLPERLSVVKLERTGQGSSRSVGVVQVEDGDMMLKILAAIDGGERLDWEHPIYEGCDISGGFDIVIEYQIHEEYIFHDDMVHLRAFQQDGACYLIDKRIRHSDNFRLMDKDFYGLLDGLFEGA